jgi:hypothetical protein
MKTNRSSAFGRRGDLRCDRQKLFATALLASVAFTTTIARAQDPLPSWNDGKAKESITEFVTKVTKEGSPDFVPPNERIATFDNDGTLWCEQPLYFQLLFALDRVKALPSQHPEWKQRNRLRRCSKVT